MTRARDLADSADKDIAGTLTLDGLNVDSGSGSNQLTLARSTTYSGLSWSTLISDFGGGGSDLIFDSTGASTGYGFRTRDSGDVLGKALVIAPNRDISFYEDTGTTAKFFWDASAESLGIGTSSPTRDLHISTTNPHIRLTDTDASNSYSEFFGGSGILSIDADKGNNVAGSYIKFGVDGSERMRITSGGNVGIGTTSPASGLHILKGAADVLRLERDATNDWRIQLTNGAFAIRDATSDVERMRIDSSGRVGIGTSSPQAPLNVFGSDGVVLNLANSSWKTAQIKPIDEGSAYQGALAFFTHPTAGAPTTPTEAMRIDSSGNVGIGVAPESWYTPLSTTALQLGGTTSLWSLSNGSTDLRTTLDNNLYVSNGGVNAYLNTGPASRYQQVNGTHRFHTVSSGTADATATTTERMRIDSAGRVTKPYQPAFRAYKSNGTISSNNVIVLFNNVVLNIGSAYSSSTGRFTAPVAGNYMFNVQGICGISTGTVVNGTLELQKNGVLLHRGHFNHDNRWENVSYSSVINMAVNDYVNLKFVQGAGNPELYGADKYTSFSGYLLG